MLNQAADAARGGDAARRSIDLRIKALAHPGRRAMLRSSLANERRSSELATVAGLSRPAATQHLSLLVTAGLMQVRPEGRSRWYAADAAALATVNDELARFWEPRLARLKEVAER
jgi:DNA-binding transcriptional ArsR family regulator